VISLIFAEYLNRIFWNSTTGESSPDEIPQWAIKLTAVAAVLIVSVLCVAARKLGTRVAVVFTSLKIIALVSSLTFIDTFSLLTIHVADTGYDTWRHPACQGESV